jgi:tRNA ligase
MKSLKTLRQTNPKAIRASVHLYPPSIYAPESSSDAQARERRITSWKMTEHMYYNADNPFPTLARGLFTEEIEDGDEIPAEAEDVEDEVDVGTKDETSARHDSEVDEDGEATGAAVALVEEPTKRARIVARGYDKFFNVDELDWTNVGGY